MLTTLRRSARLVEKNRRWAWAMLVVLGLVASLLEVMSAVMVFVLLSLVSRPDDPVSFPVLGELEGRFPGASRDDLMLGVCVVIAIFFVMRGAFTMLQTYLQARVSSNAGVALASKLLRGYLSMDYVFHLQRNSAELIRNVGTSVDIISQTLFIAAISFLTEVLVVLGLTSLVVAAAPAATLTVGICMTLITFIILRVLNPRFAELGRTNQEMTAATWQTLQQSLDGIRDLKVLGRSAFFHNRYSHQRAVLGRVRYVQGTLGAIPRVALETILVVFIVGLVLFLVRTEKSDDDALAILGLFGFTAFRALPAVSRIIVHVNSIRYSTAAIDDVVDDLLAMQPHFERSLAPEPQGRLEFTKEIRIEGVRYRYPLTDVDVLHDIDLTIRRGQSVGIVGSTGAGKSTLVDIVLGLLTPTAGRVLVDGIDVHEAPRRWQQLLGVVSQNVYLMDDTLRNNIAFGLEPESVDEDRVREAARIAQLENLVSELPLGLGTVVGERGTRLSGGERQRVAIARAIYHDPEVLVFDEGTSSLDNVTEQQLIEAVERLRGDKTIITVAHRLSTVRRCDWIALLDAGRVAAVGTFDELAKESDEFRRMAALHGLS